MPLSFRRSYRKLPGSEINRKKIRLAKPPSPEAVHSVGEFRPSRYPLVIPIGCGLLFGMCLFIAVSQGWLRRPRSSSVAEVDYVALATKAFETALADQLATVEAVKPTDMPTPAVTPAATSTVQSKAAGNAWAMEIPEAACIPPDLPQTGRVVGVVDGDTIRVLADSDGRVYSVRYLGADAPDMNGISAGMGLEAMKLNSEIVYWKQAVMVRDITDADVNGTLLRYVIVDGVFVNQAMIAAGLATTNFTPPDTACETTLENSEQQAQAAGLGVWASAP